MPLVFGALDISKTCTGWGIIGKDLLEAGAWRCPIKPPFDLKKGDIDANYSGDVADWYARQFNAWLSTYRPDVVAIEKPNPGMGERTKTEVDMSSEWAGKAFKKIKVGNSNFATTHMLNGLAMEAARLCRSRGIEALFVGSSTWRGKGGLGIGTTPPKGVKDGSAWHKQNAKTYAKACGYEAKSGDAAEGLCIAVYLRNQRESPHGLFPGLT